MNGGLKTVCYPCDSEASMVKEDRKRVKRDQAPLFLYEYLAEKVRNGSSGNNLSPNNGSPID